MQTPTLDLNVDCSNVALGNISHYSRTKSIANILIPFSSISLTLKTKPYFGYNCILESNTEASLLFCFLMKKDTALVSSVSIQPRDNNDVNYEQDAGAMKR